MLISLSACTTNPTQSSIGADQTVELYQKYNIDQNGYVRNYLSTLDTLIETGDNYEIYTDEVQTGYYYRVKDSFGDLIDEGYHSGRGNFGFNSENSMLELEYGFGGPVWEKRYYDVKSGRVSRFFSKPLHSHDELVAYFTTKGEAGNWVLVIQNMFDPAAFYQEIERNFSLYVYTAPSKAEFFEDGKKLRITYWIKPDNKEITEIIDLRPLKH